MEAIVVTFPHVIIQTMVDYYWPYTIYHYTLVLVFYCFYTVAVWFSFLSASVLDEGYSRNALLLLSRIIIHCPAFIHTLLTALWY